MNDQANIASYLTRMACERPHALAVVFPDGRDRRGRVRYTHYTYAQLDDLSDRLARGLEILGIGKGVRTVLMVRPSLELFALTFALFKAGVVPVMVDPGIGLRHLKACLANAEPEAFIGIPAAHAARIALRWSPDTIWKKVTVGGRFPGSGPSLQQVEALGRRHGGRSTATTTADEAAAILFTSGSTGPPKGVIYRHGNFIAQVEAIREMYMIQPGEIDLPTFPLFGLFDPALGMTTIIPDMDPTRPAKVNPARIVEAVENFGVTNIFGSPALLNTVGRYGAENDLRLPTVKRVISAGAPVSAKVIETFLGMLEPDARVYTPYGATESLPVASISSAEILGETRERTDLGEGVCVGRPVHSIEAKVIEISDEPVATWHDRLELAQGEVGEIVVRGPQVTRTYYNADRHNELAKIHDLEGDGFRHRMGDIGYFDDQGRLWFCGRKAHRVITADGVLFTDPCEGVFNAHPKVYRSALVGVERSGGVLPVLCVELDPAALEDDRKQITSELLEMGARHEHTKGIRTVCYHKGFPVDIRHNAKIDRARLALWAGKRVKG